MAAWFGWEARLRTFWFCLLLATAAAAEKSVAVFPIAPRERVLSAADAAAVTQEIRSAAREALLPHGFTVTDADGAVAAALEAGASAALFGRAAQLEGATVVAVGVYKPGSTAPASLVRIVGIGVDQLRADARKKIPKLITAALGLAAPAAEAAQAAGTLRMPGAPATTSSTTATTTPTTTPSTGTSTTPSTTPSTSTSTASPDAQTAPANEAPLVKLIREVTADVESLRGLRRKQNLKILILDDKLFSAAVHERAQKELNPAIVAAERARWTAFALAPANADPGKIMLSVLDEQVAGFYDPFSKQLIVRKDPPASAGSLGTDGLRVVLAHEIEHALQDQNFGMPDLRKLPDDDVRLARSALFEGDAMAVMSAYAARRAHKPVKLAILGGAAMMRALDGEQILKVSGKSPELLRAPAILREELMLPYSAGFALVAEVYRRGGFALVDKMFARPPSSSHQILHPDAYFAGEEPIPLPAPAAPPGTRIIATGRMGELGARVALELCVDRAVVKDFTPKWAGDAYSVVEGPGRALSLLWTSAWSGGGATNIANLMTLEQPCWEESALPGPSKIATAGSLVALARGNLDREAAAARQLTAHPAPPKEIPPLGDVPAPPPPRPVQVENGSFDSRELALRGALPQGWVQAADPAAELSIERARAGSASLAFLPEPLAGDALETFFDRASSQLATAQGGHLALTGTTRHQIAGITAQERAWSLEGTETNLRIDVAPFCAGKGSLTLIRVETAPGAREALERFVNSIALNGNPPACADLE
jgi:hypothetical protein